MLPQTIWLPASRIASAAKDLDILAPAVRETIFEKTAPLDPSLKFFIKDFILFMAVVYFVDIITIILPEGIDIHLIFTKISFKV